MCVFGAFSMFGKCTVIVFELPVSRTIPGYELLQCQVTRQAGFKLRERRVGMLDAGHIVAVDADDPADMGGIIRIRVQIHSDTKAGSRLKAGVSSMEGKEFDLGQVQPGERTEVGLHFILLPDGLQVVRLILEEPNGEKSKAEINIPVSNVGKLAHETANLLRQYGTPLFFVGPTDSGMYPYPDHVAWFDSPHAGEHIASLLAQGHVSEAEAERLRFFVANGYLVFEDMIDTDLVDKVNADIDDAVAKGHQNYQYGSSQRIELLQLSYENVRKLWLDRRHLRIVDLIFGAQARPCQTLTYVFGSQQDEHQDTIHLTSFPAGYMCGTWIALQDIVPDSGELIVYPGSHRENRIRMRDVGCEKVNGDWSEFGRTVGAEWSKMAERYEPLVYRPKKGTVLIWHENLLHAGSVRKDTSLERRSIVLHSFADGAVVYYDSTGKNGSAIRREALASAEAGSLL